MLKKLLAVAAFGAVLTGGMLTQRGRTEEAKLTEVKVCPMTLKAVDGEGAGNTTVGTYKVYFCCGGCPGAFAKLSKADQETKIAAAVKKQDEGKKAG